MNVPVAIADNTRHPCSILGHGVQVQQFNAGDYHSGVDTRATEHELLDSAGSGGSQEIESQEVKEQDDPAPRRSPRNHATQAW